MFGFSSLLIYFLFFFFFKQKTAYEMRISDWSSDVCSSDVHADLNDGSGDQHLYLATLKPIHDGILFRPLHPSMDKADGIAEPELQRFGASLGSGEINLFAFLHQRTQDRKSTRLNANP